MTTMKNYYNLTIGNDTSTHILSYKLQHHRPAQVFANMMANTNISNLREKKEVWCGQYKDVSPYVTELFQLIDILNEWLPEKILFSWNYNDIQWSVNTFHTHFPEHKDDPDPIHRKQLERYNDIIHHIEDISRVKFNDRLHLMLCNFHKKEEMILEDYAYFTMERKVGQLLMGYPQIGRHPWEIRNANDLQVPTDHILPQTLLGAIHYCIFHTENSTNEQNFNKFKQFYYDSGIKWPYELGDPRLALGFLHLGDLDNIDGEKLSDEEIVRVVESCNKIIGWEIV